MDTDAVIEQLEDYTMSKWLQETLAWMRTLPRHEPQDAAVVGGYEDPPRSKVVFHKVQAPAPAPAPDRPAARTPPHVIRAMVQAKRAEMRREAAQRQTDAEGEDVRRRARNEIARTFEYLRQNPVTNPYSEALARQRGPESQLDIYEHGSVPEPYTLALGEIVARRADGTAVRLPEGDDPPDGYTLALEARRLPDRKDSDN